MQIERLSPFGAKIDGTNLLTFSDEDIDKIKHTLAEQGFLHISNAAISPQEFVAFLKRFNELTFTEGETPVEGAEDLNLVTNVGRIKPVKSVWHTDTSYVPEPPMFSALQIIDVPEKGGATLICSLYEAYHRLSNQQKQEWAKATVLHGATGVPDATTTRQPLFIKHPITGKTSIYLSTPKRCTALSGVSESESEEIINFLYEYATKSDNVYRHEWQANDLLMWDNLCTMHRGDHSEVVGDRTLYRGLVSGERLEAA